MLSELAVVHGGPITASGALVGTTSGRQDARGALTAVGWMPSRVNITVGLNSIDRDATNGLMDSVVIELRAPLTGWGFDTTAGLLQSGQAVSAAVVSGGTFLSELQVSGRIRRMSAVSVGTRAAEIQQGLDTSLFVSSTVPRSWTAVDNALAILGRTR